MSIRDPNAIAWQIQNAEISVFALTGSTPFDATSGSACTEDTTDAGFDFYDIDVEQSYSYIIWFSLLLLLFKEKKMRLF